MDWGKTEMKFRDPKTGEVFRDIIYAGVAFCAGKNCSTCAMQNRENGNLPTDSATCTDFMKKHPIEAARKMGYEVIDEEAPMEKTKNLHTCKNCGNYETKTGCRSCISDSDHTSTPSNWSPAKPPICKVLGVDVGERFELGNSGIILLINDDGKIHMALSGGASKETDLNVNYLVDAYNNDRIIRKPRFTQEEVAVLKYIDRRQKIEEITRHDDGVLEFHFETEGFWEFPRDMFPSLRPGQSVKLSEIVGGNDHVE